jgi:hypothetical protein
MAPVLFADVLTVTFVYCLERLTYLWLIVLVFVFMLHGALYWGCLPAKEVTQTLGRGWSAFGEAQPTPASIAGINHQ